MPLDGWGFEQQDDVLDLLRQARERIARPGGWCQDALTKNGGRRVCMLGAIEQVNDAENDFTINNTMHRAAGVIQSLLHPKWGRSIAGYNDAPGRTQAEIVALFDAAIAARGSRSSSR